MTTTTEEGRQEAEALRADRVRNYRIKFALGYVCQHEGCGADLGLLVVRTRDGQTDDCFSVRCVPHLDGLVPMPGQWDELRNPASEHPGKLI